MVKWKFWPDDKGKVRQTEFMTWLMTLSLCKKCYCYPSSNCWDISVNLMVAPNKLLGCSTYLGTMTVWTRVYLLDALTCCWCRTVAESHNFRQKFILDLSLKYFKNCKQTLEHCATCNIYIYLQRFGAGPSPGIKHLCETSNFWSIHPSPTHLSHRYDRDMFSYFGELQVSQNCTY